MGHVLSEEKWFNLMHFKSGVLSETIKGHNNVHSNLYEKNCEFVRGYVRGHVPQGVLKQRKAVANALLSVRSFESVKVVRGHTPSDKKSGAI